MSPSLYADICMVCMLYTLRNTALPQTEGNNPTFQQDSTSHHYKTNVPECPNHLKHNGNHVHHVH